MIKLDFSSAKIYGRSAELATLQDAYRRVCDAGSGNSEVVLVAGSSGTGKSTLIRKLKEQIGSGYFVTGKFQQNQTTEPYTALAVAFAELCDLILASSERDSMKASIKQAVGSEGRVLMGVISKLSQIIGEPNDPANVVSGTTEAVNRLKFVFRLFVRCVCTASHPVVLFLDDLQWADSASMALLMAISTDTKSRHLLIVGAFRDNEVKENHCSTLRELEKEVSVQKVQLKNLDSESVNELISDLTELNSSRTQPLTDIVYHKTHGNSFFVIQFLRMLQEEGMLYFSLKTYEWTWDMGRIQSETVISDNVVDIVAGKIQRQPEKVQQVLKLAASFSFTFCVEFLEKVISQNASTSEDSEMSCAPRCAFTETIIKTGIFKDRAELIRLLDVARDEGLLDKVSASRYKFAHDRIQQAAYSLIPEGRERDLLHLRIGVLIRKMGVYDNKYLLFTAADQLNRGSACIEKETHRMELAKLNLEVAQKAIEYSAFEPALKYLKLGIDLIGEKLCWGKNYSLSLELYGTAAEMEYCLGHFQRSNELAGEVLSNAQCPHDKIHAYRSMIVSYSSQAKLKEGREVSLDLLSLLGESFPRHIQHRRIVRAYKRVKRMLRDFSDEDLLKLPLMEDEMKRAILKTLLDLNYIMWQLDLDASLVAFRMIELSLEFGICSQTAEAFGLYGMHMIKIGEIREGYRYSKVATRLLMHTCQGGVSRTSMLVSMLVNHWQEPLKQNLEPLMQAHQTFMKTGDVKGAFSVIIGYCSVYFYSGLPLEPLLNDLKAFGNQMLEYQQVLSFLLNLPLWQCVLNLMGRSENPLEMDTGEAIDQRNAFENTYRTGDRSLSSYQMQLAYYFGDLDLAAKLAEEIRPFTEKPATHYECTRIFFFGLIAIALAKRSRKRKYRRDAGRIIGTIKGWVQQGAVNMLHRLLLLQAEYASLLGFKTEQVQELFDSAIKTSARAGFLQDTSLANERAGIHFLGLGDMFWASSYLCRAHDGYREWGALSKADQLQKEYPNLISPSEEFVSFHLQARSRFNVRLAKSHHQLSFVPMAAESY